MKTLMFSLILLFSSTAFSAEPIVRCFHLTWKPGSGQYGREDYHVYMSNDHPLHSFEGWVADTSKYWQNPVLTEIPEITDELECVKKGTELKEKGKGPIICKVGSYLPDCIVPVK